MSKDKIKLLIMNTGEHIIGFYNETDGDPIVEKPVSLVPDPNSGGRSMMFIPYLQFSVEESAPFPKNEIRHVLTPQPQLVEGFNKQFGSGIVTPDQGIVGSNGLSLV